MIIDADLDAGAVRLRQPEDVKGFHVAVLGGPTDDPRLGDVLAPHGHLDGDHAWIRVDAVVALAGDAATEAWRADFDGMVAYARSKGFLSDDGTAIRAHLETA